MTTHRAPLFISILLLVLPALAVALTVNQKDDFEDGTVMGWGEGVGSTTQPTNVSDGGPLGIGDNYLRNVSSGGIGEGSRMTMNNRTQWQGNYLAAGIKSMRVDFEVSGANGLVLRLGFEGGQTSTRFVTEGFLVPPDKAWHTATFDLEHLIRAEGEDTVESVLSKVTTFRILSSTGANWRGDVIAATLCVDNIISSNSVVPVERATWGRMKALFLDRSRHSGTLGLPADGRSNNKRSHHE